MMDGIDAVNMVGRSDAVLSLPDCCVSTMVQVSYGVCPVFTRYAYTRRVANARLQQVQKQSTEPSLAQRGQ